MPTTRLELVQLSPLPPQDSVSTNFTTSAVRPVFYSALPLKLMHKCIKTQIKTINFYIFQHVTIFSCRTAETLSNNLPVMRITLDEVSSSYKNYFGIAPAGVLATGAATAGALAAGAAAGTVVGIAPAPVTGTGLTTLSITPPPTVVAR